MWALEQEAISQRDNWQKIHLQEKVWHHRKKDWTTEKKFLLLVSGPSACSAKSYEAGTLSLTSGLVSSGSSIIRVSSQSSGFLASGSGMVLGGRKSQSSSRLPPSTRLLSILTSYVLSDRTISVYRWVNSSSYDGWEEGEGWGWGWGWEEGEGRKEILKLVAMFLLTQLLFP